MSNPNNFIVSMQNAGLSIIFIVFFEINQKSLVGIIILSLNHAIGIWLLVKLRNIPPSNQPVVDLIGRL